MSSLSYYGSWIIKYLVVYLITHTLVTLVMWSTLEYLNFSLALITFFLFDLVLIVQSLFVQVFFVNSVLGTLVALTFFFLQYLVSFVIESLSSPSQTQLLLASLCPFCSFSLIMQEIFYANSAQLYTHWSGISEVSYKYSIRMGLLSLLINVIFWCLVTVYLENVIPN